MKFIRWLWIFLTVFSVFVILSPLDYTIDSDEIVVNAIVVAGFVLLLLEAETRPHWGYYALFGGYTAVLVISFLIARFSFASEYRTQEIIYRHVNDRNNRIESVWQDVGAFGYNKGYHKVIRITPIFEWRTIVDPDKIDKRSWVKVDEYVNELGLKGG